jgi:tetratricopeptide (TPR) repeat protein
MSDSPSLQAHHLALIDKIIDITLKGQIRSKEQVYQMLVQDISPGSGEIFEYCLAERLSTIENQLKTDKDELKQAKATRILRALKTIQGEWERWQKEHRISYIITSSVQQIITAEPQQRLLTLLQIIDPNREHSLTLEQLQQLGKGLQQQMLQISHPETEQDVQQIIVGITKGLASWQRLEADIVSWIYQKPQIGFTNSAEQNGPWVLWAKKVNSPFPQALFNTIALNNSITEFAAQQHQLESSSLIELAIILQCLQRGLITWFDKLIYDSKMGAKLSISTFLTFALIWSQLANGFNNSTRNGQILANGCFQIILQVLRVFSQCSYFPLYGGIFASFSGEYLRNTLDYLDEPLRRVEGTQTKARILTLIGSSMRAMGQYERSIICHQQALEIARKEADKPCEIANLNHLSRTYVAQKNYEDAIDYSQRALILSRQNGDRLGEVNALASLGYSEVFKARQLPEVEPEVYETAVNYLQRGLQLSEQLGDRQSQSLCYSSLGIAYMILQQPQTAIQYLVNGWQSAQMSGDLYLQGLNLSDLAQAYYSTENLQKAIFAGCLGMYILEQIGASEWRKSAGLLIILQGQWGDTFAAALKEERPQIIPIIGVDGYDYIPELLKKYQESMD